jgi:hypothetical protein
MRKRGVSEDEVLQVLDDPAETIRTRANRLGSYSEIHGKYIVMIHEREDDEDMVVTAMAVDRGRLRKLGFDNL